jgi:outer membrane protein OmpA-like peptidoglycan-associated protein
MSFNLNKNDGPNNPSKKTGFDLSKNDTEAANEKPIGTNASANPEPARQGAPIRNWLYALFALFIIGGAAWYFTPNKSNSNKSGSAKVAADTSQASTDSSVHTAPAKMDTAVITTTSVKSQPGNTADSTTNPPAAVSQRETIDPESGMSSGAETAGKPPKTENPTGQGATRVAASFTAGSSQPGSTGGNMPALIRKKLKLSPNLTINVLGYASSEGSPEINQQISQARADAYKKLLMRKGIAESHINALGKGIENPIASNETEAGRKKNRRVEVSW